MFLLSKQCYWNTINAHIWLKSGRILRKRVVYEGILSTECAQMGHGNTSTRDPVHPFLSYAIICEESLAIFIFSSHWTSVSKPDLTLLLVLLLNVRLRTTLLCLTNVVFLLSSSLGVAVTGQTSDGTFDCSSSAIGDTTCKIVDLALGFLSFSFSVLLLAFSFPWLYIILE